MFKDIPIFVLFVSETEVVFATGPLNRGRSIEAIAAARVYGVCRCNGRPRLADDVSELARVAESRVTNAYRVLNEGLDRPAEPVSHGTFVPRLASALECPNASDSGPEPSLSRLRRAASRRASIRPGS